MRSPSISVAEPITALRHVAIVECGEELVDYTALCSLLRVDRPRFQYTRATLARRSVAEALAQAAERLPVGYHLAVVEGWRHPQIQRRMYLGTWERFKTRNPDWGDVKLRRVVNRYTAPPDSTRVPPPHSTGGAVDMILVHPDGSPHDHTTPFHRFDPSCFAFDARGLSDEARRTRDILGEALAPTVLSNYPSEYWHWSYGDQGWAYRGGHEHAIYGPIMPSTWQPDPTDLIDEPLRLLTE